MKSLTFKTLRLLNDGNFHSGTDLAQIFNVSRTSISNALYGLEKLGIKIYKVPGRGYCMPEPINWLDKDKILKCLGTKKKNINLEIFDITKSTNTVLLQKATLEEKSGKTMHSDKVSVVTTELQTEGRGRRGQIWYSGLGDSVTFSLLWNFQKGASSLSGLSLVVGIAIVRSLKLLGIKGVMLKWPNDVLFNQKKLAGILIELRGDSLGPTLTVIGIGINIRLSDRIKSYIDQDISDLFSVNEKILDRNILMARLLSETINVLNKFSRGGFKPFKKEWIRYHEYENMPVTLFFPNGKTKKGITQGVTDNGEIVLKTPRGTCYFNGGIIKLRKTT